MEVFETSSSLYAVIFLKKLNKFRSLCNIISTMEINKHKKDYKGYMMTGKWRRETFYFGQKTCQQMPLEVWVRRDILIQVQSSKLDNLFCSCSISVHTWAHDLF